MRGKHVLTESVPVPFVKALHFYFDLKKDTILDWKIVVLFQTNCSLYPHSLLTSFTVHVIPMTSGLDSKSNSFRITLKELT